jgi:hypothetical protein
MAPIAQVKNEKNESFPLLAPKLGLEAETGSPEANSKKPHALSSKTAHSSRWAGLGLTTAFLVLVLVTSVLRRERSIPDKRKLRIAFLGNSMFYFNDHPRFFAALTNESITQNSCLHGGASISSLVAGGNGMFPQFQTDKAALMTYKNHTVYDYGACTVQQLLTGQPKFNTTEWKLAEEDRMKNPCSEDQGYASYSAHYFHKRKHHKWDYIIINDNTRNPARRASRHAALTTLEQEYVPWLKQLKAVPIFLWTHAYSVESTPNRNMTGLDDVANFTSLTGVGLRAYVDLLKQHLPEEQTPRIAPSGLAFLTVYEENIDMWHKLFHNADHLHASPHGSYLQGLVLHHTVFGKLPDKSFSIRKDMGSFWSNARMMQHAWEPANPMLDEADAGYLYGIAERVMEKGHVPASYIDYQNGEVANV